MENRTATSASGGSRSPIVAGSAAPPKATDGLDNAAVKAVTAADGVIHKLNPVENVGIAVVVVGDVSPNPSIMMRTSSDQLG